MSETTFENKCSILGDLFLGYRDEVDFAEFFEYNDLGLPLAHAYSMDLIELTDTAKGMVEETFLSLMELLGLEEEGWESLDDMTAAYDYEVPIVDISESEEEDATPSEGYELGFKDGAIAEQERIQSVAQMHMSWAKQNNKGNEYMHWHNVAEVLKPISIDYSEKAYKEQLEMDGF